MRLGTDPCSRLFRGLTTLQRQVPEKWSLRYWIGVSVDYLTSTHAQRQGPAPQTAAYVSCR